MVKNDQERPAEQEAYTPTCHTIRELFNPENREDTAVEFHNWYEIKEGRQKDEN